MKVYIFAVSILIISFFISGCHREKTNFDEPYKFCSGDLDYFFCEDFEDYEIGDSIRAPFIQEGENDNESNISITNYNKSKVLKFEYTSLEIMPPEMRWKFPETINSGLVVFELDIVVISGMLFTGVHFTSIVENSGTGAVFATTEENIQISPYSDDEICGKMDESKLITLKIIVDLDNKTYNIYIEGEESGCINHALSLSVPIDSVITAYSVFFYVKRGDLCYIDNVAVGVK